MILFSIIIPCYNVEQYIVRCLESVYSQNIDSSLFEVIIIDDESPDNSVIVATNYLKNKDNYTIISQKNRGLGGARNTGIKAANGKYLIFLDSDDILQNNILNQLQSKLSKLDFDILELGASLIDENIKILSIFRPEQNVEGLTGKDYYLKKKSIPSVCNKIYRLSFLHQHTLEFKENIYIEDFEFNTRAFFYANKVISDSSLILEGFVQTQNSITRNKNIETQKRLIEDLYLVSTSIKNFAIEHNALLENYFQNRLSRLNVNQVYQAFKYKLSGGEIKKIIYELKKRKLYYMKTPIKPIDRNLFRIFVVYFEFIFLIYVSLKNRK